VRKRRRYFRRVLSSEAPRGSPKSHAQMDAVQRYHVPFPDGIPYRVDSQMVAPPTAHRVDKDAMPAPAAPRDGPLFDVNDFDRLAIVVAENNSPALAATAVATRDAVLARTQLLEKTLKGFQASHDEYDDPTQRARNSQVRATATQLLVDVQTAAWAPGAVVVPGLQQLITRLDRFETDTAFVVGQLTTATKLLYTVQNVQEFLKEDVDADVDTLVYQQTILNRVQANIACTMQCPRPKCLKLPKPVQGPEYRTLTKAPIQEFQLHLIPSDPKGPESKVRLPLATQTPHAIVEVIVFTTHAHKLLHRDPEHSTLVDVLRRTAANSRTMGACGLSGATPLSNTAQWVWEANGPDGSSAFRVHCGTKDVADAILPLVLIKAMAGALKALGKALDDDKYRAYRAIALPFVRGDSVGPYERALADQLAHLLALAGPPFDENDQTSKPDTLGEFLGMVLRRRCKQLRTMVKAGAYGESVRDKFDSPLTVDPATWADHLAPYERAFLDELWAALRVQPLTPYFRKDEPWHPNVTQHKALALQVAPENVLDALDAHRGATHSVDGADDPGPGDAAAGRPLPPLPLPLLSVTRQAFETATSRLAAASPCGHETMLVQPLTWTDVGAMRRALVRHQSHPSAAKDKKKQRKRCANAPDRTPSQ